MVNCSPICNWKQATSSILVTSTLTLNVNMDILTCIAAHVYKKQIHDAKSVLS
jgi:hypothetical protein